MKDNASRRQSARSNLKEKDFHQNEELEKLYSSIVKDQLSPTSPFQHMILHSPESASYLLDQHIILINKMMGARNRVFIDPSIFNSEKYQLESELSVINLLFSKGQYKLLEHPLLDLMVQIKWGRAKSIFLCSFLFQLFYAIAVAGFTVTNFSQQYHSEEDLQQSFFICLIVGSVVRMIDAVLKIESFLRKILKRKTTGTGPLFSDYFEFFLILNFLATPILAFAAIGKNFCHNPSPSPSKSESKVQVKSPSQESKSKV